MPLFHIVILALIQGLTEFLPISSSGHLVLTHNILGSNGQTADLSMDIAVHVGTLFAVLLYFRRDICRMLCACKAGGDKKLVMAVIVGSLPVIIAGFAIHMIEPSFTRSLHVMAWCTLLFGIVLWVADKYSPAGKPLEALTFKGALFVGMAQILALIPGTSRSGITMSAARYLGFSRTEAARYSLLLAVVAISGAGALGSIDLVRAGNADLNFDLLMAALLAFLSGFVAISLMMRWLEKASFTPFAIYRIILGLGLLGLLYSGELVP